jgi:hypothetical protein
MLHHHKALKATLLIISVIMHLVDHHQVQFIAALHLLLVLAEPSHLLIFLCFLFVLCLMIGVGEYIYRSYGSNPQPNHPVANSASASAISRYATATAVRPSSARASAVNGGGKVAWPPCSTLFLSRLTGITDDELAGMLQSYHGLRQHKFTQDKRGERVAFVDFDSVDQASHAMSNLQSHRGMQCSYARNPLNQRTRSSGGPMMGQQA